MTNDEALAVDRAAEAEAEERAARATEKRRRYASYESTVA